MKANEKRKTKSVKRRRSTLCRFSLFAFHFSLLVIMASCTSDKHATTRPSGNADSGSAALKDPFGYSPNMDTDISGGGISEYDRKAMRKDIDNVLNP
jgi:hypothetical protein